MKKVISIILCAAMLIAATLAVVPVSAAGSLNIGTTAKVSDPLEGTGTLTVTLTVKENTGVNNLVVKLGYNADTLELVSVTNGAVFTEENGGSLSLVNTDTNPAVLYFEHNSVENVTAAGKLATVKFNIIDDMGEFNIAPEIDKENTFAADGNAPVDIDAVITNDITKNTQHVTTGLPTTIKPTCTEPGRIEKRCTTCNKLISSIVSGEALGHEWDEIERVESTVFEEGYVEYECLNCYETMRETLPKKAPASLNGTYKIEGDKLTLNLNLSNNPGINTLVAKLGYNGDALSLDSVTNGNVFCEANGGSMFQVNVANNPLVLYFEENGVSNISANGTLATLVFTVKDADADFGLVLAVDEDNTIAGGDGYVPINVPFAASTVKELNVIPGDVNGDDKVNAVDGNLLKKIVLGTVTATAEQQEAGDLNGDGKINAVDSNLLKKLILGVN